MQERSLSLDGLVEESAEDCENIRKPYWQLNVDERGGVEFVAKFNHDWKARHESDEDI